MPFLTDFLIHRYALILAVHLAVLLLFCIWKGINACRLWAKDVTCQEAQGGTCDEIQDGACRKAQDHTNKEPAFSNSSSRKRLAGFLLCFVIVSLAGVFSAIQHPGEPQVFFDEFFYCAAAQDMRNTGMADIAVYNNYPAQGEHFEEFTPPYPQGWPFLISLNLHKSEAPKAGITTTPSWSKALQVSRVLHILMPILLFLALIYRFRKRTALGLCLIFCSLPAVQKLSCSASAESPALLSIILTYLSLENYLHNKRTSDLIWLLLCAGFMGQMRPECTLLGLVLCAIIALNERKHPSGFWICLALTAVLNFCALGVMASHTPNETSYFEAQARGGFSVWGNRLENIFNNILFFCNNYGWPAALSLLALFGLAVNKNKLPQNLNGSSPAAVSYNGTNQQPDSAEGADNEAAAHNNTANTSSTLANIAWISSAWLVGITLFLSWFPFGDYMSVHSFDTWRFSIHIIVPTLLLAGLGLNFLFEKKQMLAWTAIIVVCLPILASVVPSNFLCCSEFLQKPHRLTVLEQAAKSLNKELGSGFVIVENGRNYCYLNCRYGYPTLIAPIDKMPSEGALLFSAQSKAGLPKDDYWKDFQLEPLDIFDGTVFKTEIFRIKGKY